MRVAVLQVKAVGTKYLSERERDPEREGECGRRLFDRGRDDLTHSQADRFLTGGDAPGRPSSEDLLHLVLSPGEVQDYERLGDDAGERNASFRECARDVINAFERELRVRDVRWAGAIHLNTDHPHVHVLVHREMIDEATGRPRRLEHVPRELLMHRRGVDVSPGVTNGVSREEADSTRSQNTTRLIPNTTKELVRCDGRLGERFAESLRSRALPLRQIAFLIDHANEFTRREIIDPSAPVHPSADEALVGRWVVTEAANGPRETAEEMRGRHELRLAVERLDAVSRAKGESKTRAYIPENTLRGLARENKVLALCRDGTLAPRYHREDETRGAHVVRFEHLRPAHGGQMVGFRTHDSGRLVAREVIPVTPDPTVKPAPEINPVPSPRAEGATPEGSKKEDRGDARPVRFKSRLERVTPDRPCPVCGRPDNCATTADGSRAFCRRVETAAEERGRHVADAKIKEGRDGGWWIDLTKLPDYVPREVKPPAEVTKYPLASVERRDEVYRAMLGKLNLVGRDHADLNRRGMDERAAPRADYRSAPGKAQANRVACELSAEGFDLTGVPGFWREDDPGTKYASEHERWRLNLNRWHRGYMIPVKDHGGRIEGFQIRRAEPRAFINPVTGKEDKEPKYVWLSSNNTEEKSRPEGTSPGSPVHFVRVERIRETAHAIVTEGALKGDIAAEYLDHGVITVQGVGNFPRDFGHRLRRLIPELRKVSVAYDADFVHNKDVERHTRRLIDSLESSGLETSRLVWDERIGKGIDDYLKNSLGEDFHAFVTDPVVRSALSREALRQTGYTAPVRLLPGTRDVMTGKTITGEECAVAEWVRAETTQHERPDASRLFLHRMNVRALDAARAGHGVPPSPATMHGAELREAFESGKLLTHEQLIAEQKSEDRLRLGDELRARLAVKHADWRLGQAQQFGELTRYTVGDDSTKSRRPLSLNDVGSRGTARAYRAVDERQGRIDAAEKSERHAIRREIFDGRKESDEKSHRETIESIKNAHSSRLSGIEKELDAAHRAHDEVRPVAFGIERSYRAAGEKIPVPLIDRQTLDLLHEEVYGRRDTATIRVLDELRHQLSAERKAPAHTEESARRLAAQSRLTNIDAEVARHCEERFLENAHHRDWKVDGEEKEWSLGDVDREIERNRREHDYYRSRADFFGGRGFLGNFVRGKVQGLNPLNSLRPTAFNPLNPVLNDPGIKAFRFGLKLYRWSVDAEEAKRLAAEALKRQEHLEVNVRPQITDQVTEHARDLGGQRRAAEECAGTLRDMHEKETGERAARGSEEARPLYKEAELRRMESSASVLRDPEMLREYESVMREGLGTQIEELYALVGRGRSPEEAARAVVEHRIRDAMRELPVTEKQTYTIEKALDVGKTFADGSRERPEPANRMEASEQIEELTGEPSVWRTEADKAVREMLARGVTLTPEAVEARLLGDLGGRAAARQILAEARSHQAETALRRFGEHRETTAVAYRDESNTLRTASLRDVEPESKLDVVSRLFDSTGREVYARAMVRQQLDVRGMNLSTELDAAEEWRTATKEIADAYRAELGVEVPPRFTPREAVDLERLGGGLTSDEIERMQALPELTDAQQQQLSFSRVVQEALADGRVGDVELPPQQLTPATFEIAPSPAADVARTPEEVGRVINLPQETAEVTERSAESAREGRLSPSTETRAGAEEMDDHVAELRRSGDDIAAGSPEQLSLQEIVEGMIEEEVEIEEAGLELGL